MNSCVFSLLGNNTDYSFSIYRLSLGTYDVSNIKLTAIIPSVGPPVLSRERREASNITLTPSQLPNAVANQLDIFQFVATSALHANMSALNV